MGWGLQLWGQQSQKWGWDIAGARIVVYKATLLAWSRGGILGNDISCGSPAGVK